MGKKFLCAAALLLVLVSSSFAADWPTKTINIYVTHAAGGDTDYMARQLGAQLEKILGVSVVLSNVTGSNGATCMQQYRNGAKDGYTFIATNTAALNGNEATGMVDFGYNAFEPVAVYGIQSGENIVVKASSPYKTLQDLINASKEKPGTIRLGISMGGGVYIMACVLMNIGKAQFNIIEAGDAANRLTALLGDAIDATSIPYSSAADYIEKGELRSLCTVLSKSPTLLPGQPAASDVIPELKLDTEYALLAPKGTPPEIVKAMNDAVMKACATPEWKKIVNDFSWQDPFYFDVEGSIANDSDPENFIDELSDSEAFIIRIPLKKFSAELISRCKKLRVIGRIGTGYDMIDINKASSLGIPHVIFSPHSASITKEASFRTAEMCIKGCLAVLNGERWPYVADKSVYDNWYISAKNAGV